MSKQRRGFTIVELLIVIVVIGILAAITIVAFNGVTQRARVATISSDLEGAAKQLAIDQTLNSAYPATAAAAKGGAGLKASPGTTYQYAVDNTASPQTFCITATNGTTSYYSSSTNNVPTAGACAGQGADGVAAITNLATNPSVEASLSGWSSKRGTGTSDTSTAFSGVTSLKYVADGTTGSNYIALTTLTGDISGQTVNASFAVKSAAVSEPIEARLYCYSAGGVILSTTDGPTITSTSSAWVRPSVSAVAPAGTTYVAVYALFTNATLPAGTSSWFDAYMVWLGGKNSAYADGSSPNWIWNGTPNASTSTGPPQ